MLLNIMKEKTIKPLTTLLQAIEFLRTNTSVADMLPEITKLLKMVLTIPTSSCTSERSFSALHRLKSYLRSTMRQDRLNHLAVLHIHKHAAYMKRIINQWIMKCSVRSSAFSLFNF